jgi:monoamine oxidase
VNPKTEVVVVGAGLAGLAAAWRLTRAGKSARVLEAESRAGGRIHSVYSRESGVALADLGPTWIWTPYQPIATKWLTELGLATFEQFEEGMGIFDASETVPGAPHQMLSQPGSMRVAGGTQALINRLVEDLPPGTLSTSSAVTRVEVLSDGVTVSIGSDPTHELSCEQLLVAMPLRLAASNVAWQPALPKQLEQTLVSVPTWMASQAKVVALYEHAFWRDRGLSGRIASRVGPLVEAHDHCGAAGQPAALFGFVGWSAEERARMGVDGLTDAVERQLRRCFGDSAPRPQAIHIQDWAECPYTASSDDLTGPAEHPRVGPEILRLAHFDGRVRFCIAEAATISPGLIEGALIAAESAADAIISGA